MTSKTALADAEFFTDPTVYAPDALKDQVALISGGVGGIGRAIAWLFARLGAHVVVVGRGQGKRDALAADLAARGPKASAYAADIREPDAVNALFEKVWAAHGRLDILVNSAGGQFPQAAIDFSIKGFNAVINTNLNGTWYMMQAATQRWRDHARPLRHRRYHCRQIRRHRPVARRRRGMGAAEYPRQLRRPAQSKPKAGRSTSPKPPSPTRAPTR